MVVKKGLKSGGGRRVWSSSTSGYACSPSPYSPSWPSRSSSFVAGSFRNSRGSFTGIVDSICSPAEVLSIYQILRNVLRCHPYHAQPCCEVAFCLLRPTPRLPPSILWLQTCSILDLREAVGQLQLVWSLFWCWLIPSVTNLGSQLPLSPISPDLPFRIQSSWGFGISAPILPRHIYALPLCNLLIKPWFVSN